MLTTYSFEHLGQGLPHNLRSWVIGLVHAIAKTLESERITLVLRALDVFRDAGDRADLLQHQQHRLVGTAVHRPPQTGDANEAVLLMLEEIGSVARIPEYIKRVKDESDPFRLM